MNAARRALVKAHWLLAGQFGIDPLRFLSSFLALPRFLRDWIRFRSAYSGRLSLVPCLHDWNEQGGATDSEYFWQDLLVARWIFEARPHRHVDIGSRVDGFVAHVASFRQIEVFDVRPILTEVPGVVFRQADLTQADFMLQFDGANGVGLCDSLSCLHAVEHFGLGRYGDPVDPLGYARGIANLARLISARGRLYLSTPIGRERVEFNANWVFDPRTIVRCASSHGLHAERLTVIGSGGHPTEGDLSDDRLLELARAEYNLGVFVFTKADS
jgi:hypothetical protein